MGLLTEVDIVAFLRVVVVELLVEFGGGRFALQFYGRHDGTVVVVGSRSSSVHGHQGDLGAVKRSERVLSLKKRPSDEKGFI